MNLQKEQYEGVVQRNARLAEMGTLLAQISHEINNPLAVIRGKANFLKKQFQTESLSQEKVIGGLELIERTTDRIAKIIKSLKTTSRNTDSDPMESVPLNTILQDTVVLFEEKLQGFPLGLELPSSLTLSQYSILCRQTELVQVFYNLLSNSLDAIKNTPNPWIRIEVVESESHLKLRFVDSGSGISPEIVDSLMRPFFTTKGAGKGTGLGLSISKKIIEDHGGALSYDRICKNTCFEVLLPTQIQAEKKIA